MTADSDRGVEARTNQPATTDFLSSLVDRVLNRAPVLERRRPALFEPPRALMPIDRTLLEPSLTENALEEDSAAEISRRLPAVDSGAKATPVHTESIHPDPRPSQPVRSVAPMLTETEREQEVRSDRVAQLIPVDNRLALGAREENTASSAPYPELESAQNVPAAPLRVSETIIERRVEIHAPESKREHEPTEGDGPAPGRQLPSASPITTVATHPLNRERDDKETTRSPTLYRPEPRMPVESIRDPMKAPVAIVTPQTSITPPVSLVTQLQPIAEKKRAVAMVTPQTSITRLVSPVTRLQQPIAEKKRAAPAQQIEPRITFESKPAKPASVRPIPAQRISASAATPASLQQTAPVEPTIHVTIGRVEVRATLPASQPRVARPAAPRLSLEDYLKSRSGGAK